ncbi:concanavalin A-like lectin/glucanase domain-containing protein [Dichomitus squalens]|uniref:Concanavalin A-like lectin/glucanase domain-containing protein n=1 Tax=Dichomitus squalens TaxID=114155 RepID=A0A4Q9P9D8_9APHY|nr:concanavalin A-like lectin/glucanase domain-containing protein [Dichomitus squalens]
MPAVYPAGAGIAGYGLLSHGGGILGARTAPPFMQYGVPNREESTTPPSPMGSRTDAAHIPRTQLSSAIKMCVPFLLSPSRPTSLVWSLPSHYAYPPGQSNSSLSAHPRKSRPPMPSSRLSHKLEKEDKPWLSQRDWRDRASWWLTFFMLFLGVGGATVFCFFGWQDVKMLKDSDLYMVLDESFDTLDLQNTWTRDVELGGFGNGEFEMMTASNSNLFVQNGELYILPTLTSDAIGTAAILDGGLFDLGDDCTSNNKPVQSARISTINSATIAFGKVEVRAKLPQGDWLWPAIWMLPKDNKYGAWPLSGEIDIMESRGNGISYPAQGSNFVRSMLDYGVLASVQTHIFGWWSQKRSSYGDGFHVYSLEWTPDWMRFYVDSRLEAMMNLKITGKGGKDFFKRGHYPATAVEVPHYTTTTATNGSSVAVVGEFYLILDVAAGGTSGWFPDNVGGKMWFDGSSTAMRDFAQAQDKWAATWPSSQEDRAMRV